MYLGVLSFSICCEGSKKLNGSWGLSYPVTTGFSCYTKKVDVLYVQEYIENDGKDLRICVVGDQILTSYWRVGLEGELLHNRAQGGELCADFIPQEACDLVFFYCKRVEY
ncbi:hypothetical protein [Cytobacillus horneckiae]|uniref:hypothetical protein n=1 Tax=Cytobacillus horneckiae TaxID=549687 RepID=UPI003D9AAEDF